MEDISREKEEEDRPLEEERKPEKKRRIRYETLPEMPYQKYSENIQKDMDIIFNSKFLNKDNVKFNHSKKEVKGIRRYLLNKILFDGIPAKFNSDTSSSNVFKNTTLEKDRKKPRSPIIYVKYKGKTAFSFNSSRDAIGDPERLRIVDDNLYKTLENDLNREVTEFRGDTFPGQITTQFEQEAIELSFIDRTIEGPEPKEGYIPQAYRPTFRDVDDAQEEIIGKMKMEFENQKYDLESNLRAEENRRRRAEDNLEETINLHKNHIKELSTKIREKDERIKVLENQLKTQNFSQFDKDSTNRKIQELKAEITRLENEKADLENTVKYLRKDLDDQQVSIDDLQKQVKEKQERIEELEKSSQNRGQIAQLKREKADLEKQLQAQIQRTKLAQDSRDEWRRDSIEDRASLVASEEKILSLTKEIDDLNDTIENLRKVNSEKVREYEAYKVEAEERLKNEKAKYKREKAELKANYEKEISELEAIISEFEKPSDEGYSDSQMNSLKSSLERKDITIQKLENENFRLRDLNLSFKIIRESDEKEKEEMGKEIEAQKQEFQRVKNLLEERLRKKVQDLRDVEAKNREQEEQIESYLSQLKELNKKVSQSVDRKVFQANQNEFTKLQEKNKGLKRDVLQLEREKKIVEEREKEVNDEISRLRERMEAKDNENTEFVEKQKQFNQEKKEFERIEKTFQQNIRDKDEKIRQKNVTLQRQKEELDDLKGKSEDLVNAIEMQKFYKQQFEEKDAAYKALEKSSTEEINQGVRDKDQLEEELREAQKQLQEQERERVDPLYYDNMIKDNKDLIETMKLKDKDILYSTKLINQLHAEKTNAERGYKKERERYNNIKQNFENYREHATQRERELEEWYADDLRRINQNYDNEVAKSKDAIRREKENNQFLLTQRLRPGDIKSIQILLNNLSLADFDEENYRDAYIKYKTARNNFDKKANDETSSNVQRLMFEELKKLADIRLDLLNMSFNRPARTEAGKEFIRRTDQTLAGKFYRFRMKIGKYLAGTTLGAGIMGVFYLVYDLLKASMSKVAVPVATHGKILATKLKHAASKIGLAYWNSKRTTKAGLWLTAATYIDKSKKDGYVNTFYNWLHYLYYGVEYTLDTSVKVLETGINTLAVAVSTSADVARYVANNTSTVFLMIISTIGIAITIKYSREK